MIIAYWIAVAALAVAQVLGHITIPALVWAALIAGPFVLFAVLWVVIVAWIMLSGVWTSR